MERRNLVTPGTIISPHLFTYFTLNLPQSLKALLRNNDIQFMEALQKLPACLVGKIHPIVSISSLLYPFIASGNSAGFLFLFVRTLAFPLLICDPHPCSGQVFHLITDNLPAFSHSFIFGL